MTRRTKPATASVRGLRQNFVQPTLAPLPGWPASPMTIRASRTRFVWDLPSWAGRCCRARQRLSTPRWKRSRRPSRPWTSRRRRSIFPTPPRRRPAALPRGGTTLASASARSRCFPRSTSAWDMTTTSSRRPRRPPPRRWPWCVLRSNCGRSGQSFAAAAGQRRVRLLCQRADPEFPRTTTDPGGRRIDIDYDFYATGPVAFPRHRGARHAELPWPQGRRRWPTPRPSTSASIRGSTASSRAARCNGDEILVLGLQRHPSQGLPAASRDRTEYDEIDQDRLRGDRRLLGLRRSRASTRSSLRPDDRHRRPESQC